MAAVVVIVVVVFRMQNILNRLSLERKQYITSRHIILNETTISLSLTRLLISVKTALQYVQVLFSSTALEFHQLLGFRSSK